MDPTETFDRLFAALPITQENRQAILEDAMALEDWLSDGGVSPYITREQERYLLLRYLNDIFLSDLRHSKEKGA